MKYVSFAIVLALLASRTAWAQPFASPPPGVREQGQLVSVHSGRCLGGRGHPAAEPCGPAAGLATLPVPGAGGQGGAFLLRHEASGRCLFSDRDGRFGWYVCTPA